VLDAAVARAVKEPLDVHDAADVRAAVHAPHGSAITTFVVPTAVRVASRWSNRVVRLGSKVSFSLKTLLTAVPPLATSFTLGARELHALASLVVRRLQAEGLPVDQRFVQRVTVNAYAWPSGGRRLEDAQAPALLRIAGLWATRPFAGERAGEWAGRAADAIDDADLGHRLARFRGGPPALEPGP
jgi:hypothetical protein